MAAVFVESVVFVPGYVGLGRGRALSGPATTLLGALAGWLAPVAYMLTMTVWRGDALDPLVLEASACLLSPAMTHRGALGGFLFWLIAAAPIGSPAPRRVPASTARAGV
jgi:hypothetical protein